MRPPMWFILDNDRKPVAATVEGYQAWIEREGGETCRIVEKTQVAEGIEVSTVFLGLDHNLAGVGPPVLWETMIFGWPEGDEDYDWQARYTNERDARLGHKRQVWRMRERLQQKLDLGAA